CCDCDNDGHMDLAFSKNGERAVLLHNETQTPYQKGRAMFRWILAGSLLVFVLSTRTSAATYSEDRALENDYVRVIVVPNKGGAITSMIHRKAATFPCIVDKGAGVAASGVFFVPMITVGTRAFDLADFAMTAEALKANGPDMVLKLSASLERVSPG